MSITATVMDAEMRPISEDFPVIADDFVPAIREAKRLSANGTRCCIMWQRSEDGQVAYYGPRGCSLNPQWYGAAPGRPKEIEAGRRVNVWLDQYSVERAESLGEGNVSAGIRAALSASLPSTEIANNLDLDTPKKVVCGKCRRGWIDWVPAPGQLVCEENWGPYIAVPSLKNREVRLSEPDSAGKRWLLVRMIPGEQKRYWPAQLSCKHCQKAEDAGRSAWEDWKAESLPANP